MDSFFTELRRRNVLRVAAAYALVAWIVIEAGSVLLPTFGASERFFQGYVIVVIAGFLVSLVLAWIFEVTPEGVRLEKNVVRSGAGTGPRRRRFDSAIIALLVVALAISLTLNFTGLRDDEADVPVAGNRLSIAVLPFESRSTDPDNQSFADGIHDDILRRLTNVGALSVISRTSVMEYRDTARNLREIGEELGVGSIVEGAVQRVGDNVRISATLIDAATDETIWSNAYDRQLSMQNIFQIQSEISAEITQALQATLSDKEQTRLASVPTESMEAYRLYTQGRANLYRRRLETLLAARSQFEDATRLDSDFAEAYVGLADSILLLFNNHAAIPRDEALTLSKEAIDRALELDPELGEAYASLGLLKQQIWNETRSGPELAEAEAAFRRSIALNPNNAQAYMWFGTLRMVQENYEEAIELNHKAMHLDPLARIPYGNLPNLYAQIGQHDKAIELYLEAVRTHPDWPLPYQTLSQHLQGLGRFDEAVAWGRRALQLSTDPLAGAVLVAAYVEFGDYDRVRKLFVDMPADHPYFEMGEAIDRVLDADFAGATAAFEELIESSDNPRQFLYDLVARTALLSGDVAKARDYVERGHPDFATDAGPTIDRANVDEAILYAYTLKELGEPQRAGQLLADALVVVDRLPRLGLSGHGINDVQILALQEKPFEALAALRDAIDAGFRGTVTTNGWPLALDPYLDSIRGRPEFQAMAAELEQAVLAMRERVVRAETTNDWESLLALAGST